MIDKTIIGKKFGKLTVLDKHRPAKTTKGTDWLCLCDCGNKSWVYRGKLVTGHTTSCGCKNKKLNGDSKTKLYKVWWGMKERCYNENSPSFKNYGKKGIQINNEWLKDFLNFQNWALTNGYQEDLTIERVDPNGNYEPENCEWITLSENVKRSNILSPKHIKYEYTATSPNGETYVFDNASVFCKEHNLNGNCLRRVARGERKQYKGWTVTSKLKTTV